MTLASTKTRRSYSSSRVGLRPSTRSIFQGLIAKASLPRDLVLVVPALRLREEIGDPLGHAAAVRRRLDPQPPHEVVGQVDGDVLQLDSPARGTHEHSVTRTPRQRTPGPPGLPRPSGSGSRRPMVRSTRRPDRRPEPSRPPNGASTRRGIAAALALPVVLLPRRPLADGASVSAWMRGAWPESGLKSRAPPSRPALVARIRTGLYPLTGDGPLVRSFARDARPEKMVPWRRSRESGSRTTGC